MAPTNCSTICAACSCIPGDIIINCPPTFGMYSFDALLVRRRVIDVWRDEDFRLDIEGIERAVLEAQTSPKILFLTSPNNPDGGLIPHDTLRRLLRLPLLVVVDEAYIEFADSRNDRSRHGCLKPRTWSCCAPSASGRGLAGLRLGYGIFPLDVLQHLWKFKQPYNVNVAATVAGLASLQDLPYLRKRVDLLKAERDRLFAELDQILSPPSAQPGQFCALWVEGRSAVTSIANWPSEASWCDTTKTRPAEQYIRISAGRPEDTNCWWSRSKTLRSPLLIMDRRKLLRKILASSKNIRFDDMVWLVEGFGFRLARIKGSHHIFSHQRIPS